MFLVRDTFNDNLLKSVILYGNSSDLCLYEDAEFTVKAKREVAKELYIKGMLKVDIGYGEYATPVNGYDDGTVFTVYLYVTASGGALNQKNYKAE